MTANTSRDTPAHPTKAAPACRGRDGRKAAQSTETAAEPNNQLDFESAIQLENSRLTFETGDAGVIARIVHDDGHTDYAGPLNAATIRALAEVSGE